MKKLYPPKLSPKIKSLIIFAMCITLKVHAQGTFPEYSSNTGAPGSGHGTFSPTMSGQPAPNTPQCAEWTRTAGPDESIVITGENFTLFTGDDEGKDTRFTVYGPNGLTDASIQRLEKNKVTITLNSNIPSWGMYLIWPKNNAGYGRPIAINKTDAWWVGPNKVTPGSKTSVYGRNLSETNDANGACYVYIKSTSGSPRLLSTVKVNPYKVDFMVPADLGVGDHEIWVHNGHGGQHGWSGPVKLTVVSPTTWQSTVFNVKSFGAMGDGVTDDTQAINNALSASYDSYGTVYFPQGEYLISDVLSPRINTKWVGENANTIIKCHPNFSPQAEAMVFGHTINNFQVSNLAFHADNNYRGKQEQVFFLAGGSDIKFTNVVFNTQRRAPIRMIGASHVILSNCTFSGGRADTASSHFAENTQLFIDSCIFKLTNDTENAFKVSGGSEVSVTNSLGQDLDNSNTSSGAGWGKGRFFQSDGGSGSIRYLYLENNKTIDLAVRPDGSGVDQNVGEQYLWEGFGANWSGTVISSSASITSMNGLGSYNPTADYRHAFAQTAVITKGKGIGQSRRVVSMNTSSITLESPWEVTPDQTSTIAVGAFADRIVMYKNIIDGKAYSIADAQSTSLLNINASAGIQPYGGVSNFIADRNTITDVRFGISNHSTQHHSGVDPNYFSLYVNNSVTGTRWGLVSGLDHTRPDNVTAILGTTFRKNTINSTLQAGILLYVNRDSISTEPILTNEIYEHNSFTNVKTAFSTGEDQDGTPKHRFLNGSLIANELLYKNNFVSGSSNLPAVGKSPKGSRLRENIYTGFSSSYSDQVLAVEAPKHVIEIDQDTKTAPFVIWNSGTKSFDWTLASNQTWLTLSASTGTIANENANSTVTLTANPATLAVGQTHTAELTLTADNQVKKFTVTFYARQVTSPTACTGTGSIIWEYWTGIEGNQPSQVPVNTPPTVSTVINSFATTADIADDYGSRVRGYICPPETGNYIFYIAGDDKADLYLSTSDDPANKTKIAYTSEWTFQHEFKKYTNQASVTIPLTAGQRYYIEALQKESGGGDNLAVAWQRPGQTEPVVIAGEFLIPFGQNAAPTVSITSPAANSTFMAPGPIAITASASDQDGTISQVEFFEGSSSIGVATTAPYSINWNNVAPGTYSLTAKATDNLGSITTSAAIPVTVNPATACANKGSIVWEYWTGIEGNQPSQVPVNTPPTVSTVIYSFATTADIADDYGSRVRGYICPPETGNYIFYIAGDDKADLYLSTSDDPANKTKIAYTSEWTFQHEFKKYTNQASVTIPLTAGQRYYIEALQKESGGGDNLAVAWQRPGQTEPVVIAGDFLIPFEGSTNTQMAASASGTQTKLLTNNFDSKSSSANFNLTAYPNPSQQLFSISFAGVERENAVLKIYNLQGILLETLYNGHVDPMITYNSQFDGSKYPSGTYLAKLVCGKKTMTKLLVLKY